MVLVAGFFFWIFDPINFGFGVDIWDPVHAVEAIYRLS